MPVLSPDQDPAKERITPEELLEQELAPEVDNPLGEESPLFPYADRAPGLAQNPNNQKPEKYGFWQEVRDGIGDKNAAKRAAKKGQEAPQPKRRKRIEDGQNRAPAPTPEDEAAIKRVEHLIQEKKYARALAEIVRNPRLRRIMRGKISELREKISVQALQNRVKTLAREAVVEFLIATSEIWVPVVIIILVVILAFIVGFVLLHKPQLDNPSGTESVGLSPADNKAGVYFNPSLAQDYLKLPSGKEIHFETIAGTQGDEGHPAVKKPCGAKAACFTDSSESVPAGSKLNGFTEDELQFFANVRIPFHYGYTFSYYDMENPQKETGYRGAPRPNWSADLNDYYGKMIWIANPKTKKAVAAVLVDNGPAPWTGVCAAKQLPGEGIYRLDASLKSLTDQTDLKGLTPTSCKEQKEAWDARPIVAQAAQYKDKAFDGKRDLDPTPPANYTGFTIGTSPSIQKVVGARGNIVIYGWATDQSVRPGTVRDLSDADLATSVKTKNKSSNGKTVVLDAGHGTGDNGGAEGHGAKERDITLTYAKEVKKNLEEAGYTVIMTRPGEANPSAPPPNTPFTRRCLTEADRKCDDPPKKPTDIDARAYIASRANADALVSIHVDDDGSASKWMTIYNMETFTDKDGLGQSYTRTSEITQKGMKLAQAIAKTYGATGLISRGVTCMDAECAGKGTLGLLYLDRVPPATLVELGNLGNASDTATLINPAKRAILSKAISDGIINYLSK